MAPAALARHRGPEVPAFLFSVPLRSCSDGIRGTAISDCRWKQSPRRHGARYGLLVTKAAAAIDALDPVELGRLAQLQGQ